MNARPTTAMRIVTRLVCLFLIATWMLNPAKAERPNILLIVSEDNGPELGCYGEPFVSTPVLDKLADQGVRFQNAYVPQAGCSQSRAAYLTGLYPHQNGQIGLATWKFRMYRDDTPNLISQLKASGYRTGMLGKLHVNPASAFPLDMHEMTGANFARKNLSQYAEHAEDFIRASDQPFFLNVNYPDAHRPFIPVVDGMPEHPLTGDDVKPLAYFGIDAPQLRQQTADYYNCLNRLDSLIGDLLTVLENTGKARETIVIYIGDHGADLLRGKRTSYEGGTRVPMIIRWPGHVPSGAVYPQLVSTLDLLPTILEATSSKTITGLPGQSLVPLFKDSASPWRDAVFTEYHLHSAHNFFPQRAVRTKRFKLIQNLMPDTVNPGCQFTLYRFFPELEQTIASAPPRVAQAYQRMRRPPEFELYDLESDPFEFVNLAEDPDYRPMVAELRHRLDTWRRETNDPLLSESNLHRLKAEIDACFVDGTPQKSRLTLAYPDYFFQSHNGDD